MKPLHFIIIFVFLLAGYSVKSQGSVPHICFETTDGDTFSFIAYKDSDKENLYTGLRTTRHFIHKLKSVNMCDPDYELLHYNLYYIRLGDYDETKYYSKDLSNSVVMKRNHKPGTEIRFCDFKILNKVTNDTFQAPDLNISFWVLRKNIDTTTLEQKRLDYQAFLQSMVDTPLVYFETKNHENIIPEYDSSYREFMSGMFPSSKKYEVLQIEQVKLFKEDRFKLLGYTVVYNSTEGKKEIRQTGSKFSSIPILADPKINRFELKDFLFADLEKKIEFQVTLPILFHYY